jgi:hypothetical protein
MDFMVQYMLLNAVHFDSLQKNHMFSAVVLRRKRQGVPCAPHIVEKRIKNFGAIFALILNFKGVFMCNGKGYYHQPD